jgi:hypothetical protein
VRQIIKYHSALHDELDITKELGSFKSKGSRVFKHDITKAIPKCFLKAEAVYSEPSWQQGYSVFQNRAGLKDSTFQDYLACIKKTIEYLHKPTFLVMGKHMTKILNPKFCVPVKLHKWDCLLGIWNTKTLIKRKSLTVDGVLDYISDTYDIVADFSCGYGSLAGAMISKNKKFICSDINGKCVYYIAKTYMGYKD